MAQSRLYSKGSYLVRSRDPLQNLRPHGSSCVNRSEQECVNGCMVSSGISGFYVVLFHRPTCVIFEG
jgi:hypothetical protein